jgi:biopolymer transport protein ExbD
MSPGYEPLSSLSGARGGAKKARIEIIPLIDVIFFLLATFVLFTLSLSKIQSMPVELPTAASLGPTDAPAEPLILQISNAGTAYWNGELITLAEIAPRLRELRAASPLARVLVGGDDQARYGDTIRALDEVRKAGITQVSIETAPRPRSP